MNIALQEAKKAYNEDEIPIGAIIVIDNKIIAKAHNQVERLNDSTAHAEILAITGASEFLGSKYLTNATIYITVEPCIMCAGAIFWSKISKVVYGASDVKFGYKKINANIFNSKMEIMSGVMETECSDLMKNFFNQKRVK